MLTSATDPTASTTGRLLAGVLLLCLTLGAVPALAHCCADRCHDDDPLALTDDCSCTLEGVAPPMDALPLATEPHAALVDAGPAIAVAEAVPTRRGDAPNAPLFPLRRPHATVVLLI